MHDLERPSSEQVNALTDAYYGFLNNITETPLYSRFLNNLCFTPSTPLYYLSLTYGRSTTLVMCIIDTVANGHMHTNFNTPI